MPDIDIVLEAEKSIQQIAEELKKMKNAADLLNSAQEKVKLLLESSKKITESVNSFVQSSKSILDKITEIDFKNELSILKSDLTSGFSHTMTEYKKVLEGLKALIEQNAKYESDLYKSLLRSIDSQNTDLNNQFNKVIEAQASIEKKIKEQKNSLEEQTKKIIEAQASISENITSMKNFFYIVIVMNIATIILVLSR